MRSLVKYLLAHIQSNAVDWPRFNARVTIREWNVIRTPIIARLNDSKSVSRRYFSSSNMETIVFPSPNFKKVLEEQCFWKIMKPFFAIWWKVELWLFCNIGCKMYIYFIVWWHLYNFNIIAACLARIWQVQVMWNFIFSFPFPRI